jgi:hypothetical protein
LVTTVIVLSAACSPGSSPRVESEPEGDSRSPFALVAGFPGPAAEVLRAATAGPAPATVEDRGERGFRISSIVEAVLPETAAGPISFSTPHAAGRLTVRRGQATTAKARTRGSAIAYEEASPGTDALFYSADHAVEELLVVKRPRAFVDYELELPEGTSARLARPSLVELVRADGNAWLRMRADRAWNSAGDAVIPKLEVRGTTIRLGLPPSSRFPLLVDPAWETTGVMADRRASHVAAQLGNGKVLVAGGCTDTSVTPADGGTQKVHKCTGSLGSAELFDPALATFTSTGPMLEARHSFAAVPLQNGKVLIVGGCGGKCADPTACDECAGPLASAELFDPYASGGLGSFAATGSMAIARHAPTATRLSSGKVLVAGGFNGPEKEGHALATAEIYDPGTGTFSAANGTLTTSRGRHTAALLGGGRVLLAGGVSSSGVAASTELFDPSQNTFTPGPQMSVPRRRHSATALPSGKVLLAGGSTGMSAVGTYPVPTGTADLFDPVAGTIQPTGALKAARYDHAATLLPSGQVLVSFGCKADWCGMAGIETTAELYDPVLGSFASHQASPTLRRGPTITVLHTGKVAVIGGRGASEPHRSAEVLDPSGTPAIGAIVSIAAKMASRRLGHTATLLPTGDVLLAGGIKCLDSIFDCLFALGTAELYHPGEKLFGTGGAKEADVNLTSGRVGHSATLLPDGRVLLAGGCSSPACGQAGFQAYAALRTAEIYDPLTKKSTASKGQMHDGRLGHSATVLPTGQVLVAGGCGDLLCQREENPHLASAEVFDPKNEMFTLVGPMHVARGWHSAQLLESGKVLVLGGRDENGTVTSAELFDPWSSGGQFQLLPPPQSSRTGHAQYYAPSGRVLMAGGLLPTGTTVVTRSAEYYDPGAQTSIPALPMAVSRYWVRDGAVVLPSLDAQLSASCADFSTPCSPQQKTSAEVFDAQLEAGFGGFRGVAVLGVPRGGHTATRLPDGTVLIAGGCDANLSPDVSPTTICGGTPVHDTAELFDDARLGAAPSPFRPLVDASGPFEGVIGEEVELSGQRFSSTSSNPPGVPWDSSPGGPTVLWFPEAGGYALSGAVVRWTETSARWRVPATARHGAGWLHVVANGLRSVAVPFRILPPLMGSSCVASAHCATGFCADGVCCDTACTGSCVACSAVKKGSGADGTCGPTPQGQADPEGYTDPQQACAVDPPDSTTKGCGLDGTCDGTGKCRLRALGAACDTARCEVGRSVASTCDGAGQCKQKPPVDCAPYVCSPGSGACAARCDGDNECVSDARCSSHSCVHRAGKGSPCTLNEECATKQCVEGTCCSAPACFPYSCAGGDCHKPPCQSPADCASGARCDPTTGECKSGAACTNEFTAVDANGLAASCLPYRCKAGACQSRCAAKSDCATGYTCDRPSSSCVAIDTSELPEAGCTCVATGRPSRTSRPSVALLAVCAFAALARRRRPGKRAAG